ncbi:MAG: glycosyltransferase family 4 protein [Terrimicrobiaceae bacterium]
MVAEGLAARGHEVRVVTIGMKHLPTCEQTYGVRVIRPRSWRRSEDTCAVHEMAGYLITALPETIRQLAVWKPDVMHAHFVVPTGVLAWVTASVFRCPLVVTAHLGDVPGGVPEQTEGLFRLAAPMARLVWRSATRRTAVSSFVANLATRAFGSDSEVILNGIPAVKFIPDFQQGNVPRLLMVGRLSVQKNPVMAIEGLGRLRDLEWELDIIGQGPLESAVRKAVAEQGLTQRVRFHGWLEGEIVHCLMRESDVLLMPSLHEGLPMAAVEALWHGLAIVGTRIGGLRDVVRPGQNGALSELHPDSFADALRSLLSSPTRLKAAREASLRLAAEFDFEKSLTAYERVLASAADAT